MREISSTQEGQDLLRLGDLVHQHAAGRMARLARVGEATLDVPTGGLLEIGVSQHDVGRFPAQFQTDALDGAGGGLAYPDPGGGRTGERDHVHLGMGDKASPTTLPLPITRLNTPGGVSASSMISAKATPLAGEASLGFSTMVQPAAMA